MSDFPYLSQPPDSCRDFLGMCGEIFSSEFSKAIDLRIRGFDAMIESSNSDPMLQSSGNRLSDVFIRDQSRRCWLELMINSVDVLAIKLREQDNEPPWYLLQKSRSSLQGYDGQSDDAPAPAAAAARGIQQIVLRSPDLKTAWMRSQLATAWLPPTRDFNPGHHGAPLVFHGTNTSNLYPETIAALCQGRICLQGNPNQWPHGGSFIPLSMVFAPSYGPFSLAMLPLQVYKGVRKKI